MPDMMIDQLQTKESWQIGLSQNADCIVEEVFAATCAQLLSDLKQNLQHAYSPEATPNVLWCSIVHCPGLEEVPY